MNSRAKGKRGELEFAKWLREHGVSTARRGQQYSGAGDSPDVIGLPELLHPEVKYSGSLRLYDALEQAQKDRNQGQVAVVFHRQVRRGTGPGKARSWVAILDAEDFLEIINTFLMETDG